MAARKKSAAKTTAGKKPNAKKRAAKKVAASRSTATKTAARKPVAKKPTTKKPMARKAGAGRKAQGSRLKDARTRPVRTNDRVTPRVHESPVPDAPLPDGFRPSRIMTTRPRPVIRQMDPSGVAREGHVALQPWEVEIDDVASLEAARAREASGENGADDARSRLVTTPASAEARIEEARAAGWTDDRRMVPRGLTDARVLLVHPSCRFIDGKAVRDVSLSVHVVSGRATLIVEGPPRARTASWRMREDEELPVQLARWLDDPAQLARIEHASRKDRLGALDALDRNVVTDLRGLADPGRDVLVDRLIRYCQDFAAIHAAFGLHATADAAWERFATRRGSVLERLHLPGAGRRAVSDAFDAAVQAA